mmetsp:Transcript_39293/g.69108  ORF Transcript_39293/g.69108 Transcript_39293/m.69108 type:complete len:83 (+) Transcript_39293:1359-1607(+)
MPTTGHSNPGPPRDLTIPSVTETAGLKLPPEIPPRQYIATINMHPIDTPAHTEFPLSTLHPTVNTNKKVPMNSAKHLEAKVT